jgi:hypothetical protein
MKYFILLVKDVAFYRKIEGFFIWNGKDSKIPIYEYCDKMSVDLVLGLTNKLFKMKNCNVLFKSFFILSFIFLITGCEKDDPEITGCTDPKSINYNVKATKNDGSCKYSNGGGNNGGNGGGNSSGAELYAEVVLSQLACDNDCEIGKTIVVYLRSYDNTNYEMSYSFFEECNMDGYFEDILESGEYCIDVYELVGTTEFFIKDKCFTLSQSDIDNDALDDETLTLYNQDICD